MPHEFESRVQSVAVAADGNLVTHAGWVQRRLPGMSVIDRPDLVIIDSGLPCDTFNVICRARLNASTAAPRVQEAVEYFRCVGRPFSWWVGPADRPANLSDYLLAAGLERAESELAMATDLSTFQPRDLLPQGLRVARVETEAELVDFARINAANWTPPDSHVLRFYRLATPILLAEDSPLWFYVGYLNDKPVASAELTVGGGVAGLYNISTIQEYRRRGFGTVLTLRALIGAKERGCQTAVLQAAPDGVRIYEQVGFRSFGNITEYKRH